MGVPLYQALAPKESRAGGCTQGTGCTTGRGQGGDTLSLLVSWALVRTFFSDKSALRVGCVEMRMEQETGGAGEWKRLRPS